MHDMYIRRRLEKDDSNPSLEIQSWSLKMFTDPKLIHQSRSGCVSVQREFSGFLDAAQSLAVNSAPWLSNLWLKSASSATMTAHCGTVNV